MFTHLSVALSRRASAASAPSTVRCFHSSSHVADSAVAAAATPSAVSTGAARPVSLRQYGARTLRRQAFAQSQPWYIPPKEYRRLKRGGFDEPVQTKLPDHLRLHKPEHEMRKLRKVEADKLSSDAGRHIADFQAGDKIIVTKYLSLHDRTKFERIAGLCLARTRGTRLSASFLLRAHKLGEDYELRLPLYSPFIARIDIAEYNTRHFRQKMYYLRNRDRSNWETKIPTGLGKPSAIPITVARVAEESKGRVRVLTFDPMKKVIKERKAGGLGAEMAAAGTGGKKKK